MWGFDDEELPQPVMRIAYVHLGMEGNLHYGATLVVVRLLLVEYEGYGSLHYDEVDV